MKTEIITAAMSRRQFLGGAFAAAAVTSLPVLAADEPAVAPVPAQQYTRKIKLGVVGNGGRGSWIAKLFHEHGGYDLWAVADYFQEEADKCGAALGVDSSRRFSTLSGFKRLIESGVEAVAVETPPYFIPEQVTAAVDAGLHVYMAKPVASDVPGALRVLAAGQLATRKSLCFIVDYQLPTDPANIEAASRIRQGALGRLAQVVSYGFCGGQSDPPRTANLESRLRHLIWVNDVVLGCDYIGNFDIHAIDAALWTLGRRPVSASGASGVYRPSPHGDARDICSVVYEYADGVVHEHIGQALHNNAESDLRATFIGTEAVAQLNYDGKVFIRGGPMHYSGICSDNYTAGARRNIARFYREITEGRAENETCQRAVDGVLTCILGYEAAARRERLTMDQVLKENKSLPIDLAGLRT
ncbi:MAG TPA: Gfo/Idh/MocA family oxidoreductase [Opitutaceae bacterium]|nr:Gfo/Idh/MocA family oxidoreductase [Opitutaceae bacterium]